jgi:streptomycin 6-kinase
VSTTFDVGKQWLKDLPQLIAECESRWDLIVAPPFAELSYNYVAPATMANGTEIVLKLGVSRPELGTEIEALRHYNGRGICRLLDADIDEGVLLLERLQPGVMLTAVAREDDEKATTIAAEVMKKLWRPLPVKHNFPSIADWAEGLTDLRAAFDDSTGPFPPWLVEIAESLFEDLLSSSSKTVLLHGDLHHYNILSSEREPWLAIDPKGLSGEPAFEVAAFIRNPLDLNTWPQLEQTISRRFDIFAAQLEIDRQRLIAWCLALELLSNWWDYEDCGGKNWQMNTRLADIFVAMLD